MGQLCDLFNTDDLVELFEMLDRDGGGSVSINEFCDEMTKLATTQMPKDQIRVLKQMSIIRNNILEHNVIAGETMQSVCEMAVHQDKVDNRISAVEKKLVTIDT